jgi:hypothetical protein
MNSAQTNQITKETIEEWIANGVPESKTLDYKATLPKKWTDGETKEFLADVSSFANASGGYLVYGVTKETDSDGRATGKPAMATGLADISSDQEILRLEQMIHTGITPRLPSVQTHEIAGFSNGPVIILKIANSWSGPHMVSYQKSSRFYSRGSAGRILLDFDQIKTAFIQSDAIPDRIRAFRDERLGKILTRATPAALVKGPCVVLHLVPVASFAQHLSIDVSPFCDYRASLPTLGTRAAGGRLNLDGYVSISSGGDRDAEAYKYTQIFRNGAIEAVDTDTLSDRFHEARCIPSISFEESIINGYSKYSEILRQFAIDPPWILMLSLLDVRGFHMFSRNYMFNPGHKIDRDHILVPELVIESDCLEVAEKSLRPVFDIVWQSCGFQRSLSYDENGDRNASS